MAHSWDEFHMRAALALAQSGLGTTAPNPSVGCIIVQNNQVVGQGVTAAGGRPHAETIALEQAGNKANGATVYVTLEPCCHTGNTGPCTTALIEAKVKRVVIATRDPFGQVSGQGVATLKNAKIDVTEGVCETEARMQNAGFFSVVERGRPLVTVKLATSLDGKIATQTGESQWITNDSARQYAHELRATHDAVMVGIGTALADDPMLTCRHPAYKNRNPIRIVADSRGRLPLNSRLAETALLHPCWILSKNDNHPKLADKGVRILACPAGKKKASLDIQSALEILAKQGITRLLVEGGRSLVASLLSAHLVDELIWIRAPLLLGEEGVSAIGKLGITSLKDALPLMHKSTVCLGEDTVETYRLLT